MALADRPESHTNDKEHRGMHNAAPCRQGTVSGHTGGEGFAGGTHQRKAGHGGSKHTHQQHERADGSAGNKVIFAGTAKERATVNAKAEKQGEVA